MTHPMQEYCTTVSMIVEYKEDIEFWWENLFGLEFLEFSNK